MTIEMMITTANGSEVTWVHRIDQEHEGGMKFQTQFVIILLLGFYRHCQKTQMHNRISCDVSHFYHFNVIKN